MAENQRIDAVSVTVLYENILIQQSGLIINEHVVTTAGQMCAYAASGLVPSVTSYEITIGVQRGNNTVGLRGFIVFMWHADELKNAIIDNSFGFDYFSMQSHSCFVVIGLNHCTRGDMSYFHFTPRRTILYKGMDIITVSTPFGTPLFMNCVTRGVVSNAIDNALFITDARLSQGCQGGPVYHIAICGHSILVGIILAPLRINGDYTGFSLCCNIFTIYESYCRNRFLSLENIYNFSSGSSEIHHIAEAVLPVRTPIAKGSSVLINENGLLVTCGHVIKFDINIPVEVDFAGRTYRAKVLCTSSPHDVLDIAFIQIYADCLFPACRFYESSPMKGTPVYMIGYEKVHENFIQLISKGTVLTHENQGPVYTSCISNKGKSGGGVFLEDGRLLAVVVGVMSWGRKRIVHSWHGICIPVTIMAEPLSKFYQTGDLSFLETFCKTRDLPLPKWRLLIITPVYMLGFQMTNENFMPLDSEETDDCQGHVGASSSYIGNVGNSGGGVFGTNDIYMPSQIIEPRPYYDQTRGMSVFNLGLGESQNFIRLDSEGTDEEEGHADTSCFTNMGESGAIGGCINGIGIIDVPFPNNDQTGDLSCPAHYI